MLSLESHVTSSTVGRDIEDDAGLRTSSASTWNWPKLSFPSGESQREYKSASTNGHGQAEYVVNDALHELSPRRLLWQAASSLIS